MVRPIIHLDKATAEMLMAARKDFAGQSIRLERSPLGAIEVKASTAVLGHTVEIAFVDRPHGNRQCILSVRRAHGNLARLCRSPEHGFELHWHWFEDMRGIAEHVEDVAEPPQSHSLSTLAAEVFVPRLNIERLTIEEGLL